MKHYVIGDVRGHYDTLIALVAKLPDDGRLIFVGDLIDRGGQSAEVVRFVRENNHLCVMGNHEDLMAGYGQFVLNSYKNNKPIGMCNEWGSNGATETLLSYGIAVMDGDNLLKVEGCQEALKQFEDDREWMKNLPLYLELPFAHPSEKPVVVSHAPIADVWEMRSDANKAEVFRHKALTNRRDPNENAPIFNIFGHFPVRWRAEVKGHYVNVDTGCNMGKNGYNRTQRLLRRNRRNFRAGVCRMNHYVIGDVHGSYDTLMELVSLLPHDARLIFVGDLIDRGAKSAEVVRFVRENNHLCVMGNHEEAMITQGFVLMRCFETDEDLPTHSMWYSNGGVWTLRSYGIVKLENGKPVKADDFAEGLKQFKDDMKWMEKLPLYLELPIEHPSEKPVVVSHAPIASAWAMRKIDSMYGTFARLATTCRRDPDHTDAPIFNVFGHTPMQNGPRVKEHFVNIDTGCYMAEEGYNSLSAYCIETGEVISVKGS